MADTILVKDLKIYAYHGVFEEEKKEGQFFYVSLKVNLDFEGAASSDDLDQTVSYADLCHFTNEWVQAKGFDLIEKVARDLAEALLEAFPRIQALQVTLKKPQAPIGLPLDYPAVVVEKGWQQVYVGVGSNMGERDQIIHGAYEVMEGLKGLRKIEMAQPIESQPWGGVATEAFLNSVIAFETYLSPKTLLRQLQAIETQFHRTREVHWGNRTLDLDILLYGDVVTSHPDIVIPHPYLLERLFVLEPLCDLNPYLVHPLTRQRMMTHLNDLKQKEV